MKVLNLFKCINNTLILLALIAILLPSSNGFTVNKKHSNEELIDILIRIHKQCPTITSMYYLNYGDVDRTILHNKLYVFVIGKYPDRHTAGIPEFGVISNLHGNEVIGREFSILLAEYLCRHYNQGDREVIRLIESQRIHILPTMNPDGYVLRTDVYGYGEGHNNYFFQDLNHDFPDLGTEFFRKLEKLKHNQSDHLFTKEIFLKKRYQRETLMVMNWLLTMPFVLQINLHSASINFNYGYQQSLDKYKRVYNPTPDDDIYRFLGTEFVRLHPEMREWRLRCPSYWIYEPHGLQKGSTWLSVKNGWHDFTYLSTNMMGNNVFLSCQRNMLPSNILFHWKNSFDSIMFYIRSVHLGVKGVVKDTRGRPIENAIVKTVNLTETLPYVMMRYHRTGELGDYYRMLLPGQYAILVTKEGYQPSIRCFRVYNDYSDYSAVVVNFELNTRYYYIGPECADYNIDQQTVKELLSLPA